MKETPLEGSEADVPTQQKNKRKLNATILTALLVTLRSNLATKAKLPSWENTR